MTAPERDDVALLTAVANGDRDALAELYRRHARWMLVRLQHRCGDPDVADSALQDAFVSVWRSAGRYRPSPRGADTVDIGGWLWTIAVRRLVDLLRRRPAPQPVAMVPEPEPLPAPGTPEFDLVANLPVDLHAVVRAVYLDGLTTSEAAVLLGIPAGTVKSRLARARPLLREELR